MTHTFRTITGALIASLSLCSGGSLAADDAAPAPPSKMPITRDTWVSAVGSEVDGNNGGSARLKLKGIQEWSLVDVDPAPLKGRVVKKATLHVRLGGNERLHRVAVGTLGAEWAEGTGSSYDKIDDAASYLHRIRPDRPWALHGGDMNHVMLGEGGTIWAMRDATAPDADGWQTIEVDPRVIAARGAGLSYGFVLMDDTGTELTRDGEKVTIRLFPNRYVFSKDSNRASAPYFTVELGAKDDQPPAAPRAMKGDPADLRGGESLITWEVPEDAGPAGTLGFVATIDGREVPRELMPMAGRPGQRVEMHVRDLKIAPGATIRVEVRAVDAAGNVGPAASLSARTSGLKAIPLPPATIADVAPRPDLPLPNLGPAQVAVIDELDKVRPSDGSVVPASPPGHLAANHLWDAQSRKVRLAAARNEFVAFQVVARGGTKPVRPEITWAKSSNDGVFKSKIGRFEMVNTPAGPMPDPIVPLEVPSAAGPEHQAMHVEVYVGHDAAPGVHQGSLTLKHGDDLLKMPIELTVHAFALPDRLSFLPEMNCYGLPAETERDYYRLAHENRTVINRLPYSQRGEVADGCAPGWDAATKTLDWTEWDRRFGPLLDGSAFADLPRKNVPIEVFYLPLHENWPTPMEGHYNGSAWADEAFPSSYWEAFTAASKGMTEHVRDRKWSSTLFHGFLNNKHDYKRNGWSRGSSPWLLDEPASFQDFWALRSYAKAFDEGVGAVRPRPANVIFRADISRPQWRRETLDGLLGYNVISSAFRTYRGLTLDRKRKFGEMIIEYGSTVPVSGPAMQPAAWCLDVWALGGDGVIPWQTVGRRESWDQGDELSLFYPGRARQGEPKVVPSVRLKAYRRGQQDIEYLELYRASQKAPRWALGDTVRDTLALAAQRRGTATPAVEDAGRLDYDAIRASALAGLRARLAKTLDATQAK
jgi:hypothetical protein